MLGEIDMPVYGCLAELIDNSIDAFLDAENAGEKVDDPSITISFPREPDYKLVIEDNARGMSLDQLEKSLRAGYTSKARYGSLGLFGMGFNVATARLGVKTEITSGQHGAQEESVVVVDHAALEKNESFNVPVSTRAKDVATSGTRISITLKPYMRDQLTSKTANALRKQLGDIYSYMLRSEVPGLSKKEHQGSSVRLNLVLDGKQVKPTIPCVWADTRSAMNAGQKVEAIQYFDKDLPEQRFCLDCGEWTSSETGPCVQCGGKFLELRQRKLFGWVGIQRFLDTDKFGIDFIRNGRKILRKDKSIFSWVDPDSGDVFNEYPVEMPANKGRIVGEVHLDHVRVNYLKNGFEEESSAWKAAVRTIRGEHALKARSRGKGVANDSPLARLFTAFRRNDAGAKYLIPSEEGESRHVMAAEWAKYFEQGDPEYWDDSKWWAAVQGHEAKQGRELDGASRSHLDSVLPPLRAESSIAEPVAPQYVQKIESASERFDRVIPSSRKLLSLSQQYRFAEYGNWSLEAYIVPANVATGDKAATELLAGADNSLKILIFEGNSVVFDFAREPRDIAIHAFANTISARFPHAEYWQIYQQILEVLNEEKLSDAAVLGQAEDLLRRLLIRLEGRAESDPALVWAGVTMDGKQWIQQRAFEGDPSMDVESLGRTAGFVQYMGFRQVGELVVALPEFLLDGAVFTGSHKGLTDSQKIAQAGRFSNWLHSLDDLVVSRQKRSTIELKILKLQLDRIDQLLVRED
jgi:hypothetical protein